MPAQYRHTCHIIVTLVTLSSLFVTFVTVSIGAWTDAERPGKCHAARSVLYTHREYPKAWKFDIGGFFLYCNYSIFFEAELSP